MTDAELEGFRPDKYFARSWALLTRDRGWIKPVMVMAAATLIPIVGAIGALGYVLEWARLTAWGVASSPKQKHVQVGACIVSGWRAFVVVLCWGIACSLVSAALLLVPLFGPLLTLAWTICSVFVGLMLMVAALRTTIYQKIAAGLRLSTIWEMIKSDVGGLMQIFGMQVAGAAIFWVISGIVTVVAAMLLIPQLLYYADYISEFDAIMSQSMKMSVAFQMIVDMLGALTPALVVTVVLSSMYSVVMMMLGYTAVALWMRQFNVPAWGREQDPLPAHGPAAYGPGAGAYGPAAASWTGPGYGTAAPRSGAEGEYGAGSGAGYGQPAQPAGPAPTPTSAPEPPCATPDQAPQPLPSASPADVPPAAPIDPQEGEKPVG